MEHRQGTRIRTGMPVSVTVGHSHLGWFTSRDVSNGGIAVTGDIDLPCNCVTQLVIEVRKGNRIVTETARAVVVHRRGGCIGLMWISHGIPLQRLLPDSAHQAAA